MKRMLITIVVSLWLPQFGLAQGAARTQLNAFANGVKTMTARFEQTVLDVNGKVSDRSAGSLKLQSPRQFRWDILEPYEQHIVADGDHVWVHDVELEQVNVRSQSFDEANSPLAVLLDLGMLDQEFASSETGKRARATQLKLAAGIHAGLEISSGACCVARAGQQIHIHQSVAGGDIDRRRQGPHPTFHLRAARGGYHHGRAGGDA